MVPPPAFDPALAEAERALIREELAILEAVRSALRETPLTGTGGSYDESLLDLRDALGEARQDEVAQILTQIDSLASLSAHLERRSAGRPADLRSPYFGHLRVAQGGRVLDILIGNHTVIAPSLPHPIIDWRHAPISRVFYRYREGDEYDEVFGGRQVSGTIIAHRRLTILQGALVHIDCDQGVFQRLRNRWQAHTGALPHLRGGAGTAVRPGTLHGPGAEGPALGVAPGGIPREDRHLQAITGLIDPDQFELITRPDSGIVTIDGGAGSGKTTIALHRMAFLVYRDPRRFQPANMLGVVFNQALGRYISRLLPALGVEGCRIEVYEELAESLRRRHYPGLPAEYSERTPFTVVRFKQHPAALAYLLERLQARGGELREAIRTASAETASVGRAPAAWERLGDLPLGLRLDQFARWVLGRVIVPEVGAFGDDWLARQRLGAVLLEAAPDLTHPQTLALAVWEEAFLHAERLAEAMERLAPGTFTRAQIEEICQWALEAHARREEFRQWRSEPRQPADAEAPAPEPGELEAPPAAPEPPLLDREDDTLLLLLFRHTVGPLRSRRQRPYTVSHLMVDEVQDFGALELRLLLDLAAEPRSVTLAGDTAQKMILHHTVESWDDLLRELGLEGTAVSPLSVGYRSTGAIMRFAQSVLGPLAPPREWRPTREGAPVELLRFTDTGQAVMVLADALRALMRSEPMATVALIARHADQAETYYQGLAKSEQPKLRRVVEQNFQFQPGIEVTEVQQVKGLEYDYVILLDVDEHTYGDDAASRYLLHIGATRAAHQLWLVACRNPSRLIPAEIVPQVL
ncbi:MAG: ATP-binding domain-containing protein [Candidatus Lambdaproteobacteria bacterium]|nr:ATP-binding domain-containing protein [Candidatus Lambdaproteobacteria bacterium]